MTLKKYFTPEEANAALVLVSPIVRDILEKRFKAISLTNDVKKLKELSGMSEEELHDKLDEAEKILDTMNYNIRELENIGCMLKDTTLGLVDFLSLHGGREIFLCWRFGEDQVRFWHETNTGFHERKPLALPALLA